MAKSAQQSDSGAESTATATTAGSSKTDELTRLMNDASEALTQGRYFECERLADEALHRAWKSEQYELMARICLPLQEARRQRRIEAIETDKLHRIEEGDRLPGTDDRKIKPGCYVVFPPNVGADARQIRIKAVEQDVPVVAFACEPKAQSGLLPVVVVGPMALRTRINPPKEMSPPWCLTVIDALTNEGLATVDRTRPITKQVDVVLDLLDSLPESEQLHQELAELAAAAARDEIEESADE